MMIRNLKRKQGFTLVELMIVIGVVAILLALAYPSYVDYVRKGKRGDAQQVLMNWAVNQEIWRSNHPTYADADDIAAPTGDHYVFSLDGGVTSTSYTLQAVGQDDQAKDKARDGTECETLQLNQNGQKTPASCWE